MRKSILILGHSYAAPFTEINNQYTRVFDPDQYSVTVVYLVGTPCELVKQKHIAEHVIFLNLSKKSIRGLKIVAILQLLKLCRQMQFDIAICHRYKPIYIMLWVAQFYRFSTLFFVMHELSTLSHFTRKLLIAALIQKNMVFAGVSNAVREDIQSDIWRVPPDRVITLHNAIDITTTQTSLFSREIARHKLHLPQEGFVFGNIARLAKNKDQQSLIAAFALIKPDCPNAKLVIIGKGELETALKQQVKQLHLTEEVIFIGFVEESARYMKAFDIFVLPSIQEAFGRVLLEAMTAEIPIIATAVNGIPEVLGQTGLLIPANNIELLAKALLNGYQTDRATLNLQGKQCFSQVNHYFSQQHFNETFWALAPIKQLFADNSKRNSL